MYVGEIGVKIRIECKGLKTGSSGMFLAQGSGLSGYIKARNFVTSR
jgi:hypothetical protein